MKKTLMAVMALLASLGSCNIPTDDAMLGSSKQEVGREILFQEANNFYVRVNFAIPTASFNDHPEVTADVIRAISTWADAIPIQAEIESIDEGDWVLPGTISVVIMKDDDVYASMMPRGSVGFWDPSSKALVLMVDRIQRHDYSAYSVALHELGHAFGVPHIGNANTIGRTGMIVLDDTVDARAYVMYPTTVTGADQETLSELEIRLASNYVINGMTSAKGAKECYFGEELDNH